MIRCVTRPNSREDGFTIIEMVVVVAIIALLAGILTPLLFNILDDANETATKDEMATLRDATMRYYEHVKQWPPTWVTDGQGVYLGLMMLAATETEHGYLRACSQSGEPYPYVKPVWAYHPATGSGWKGPYIADTLGGGGFFYDAWEEKYAYVSYPDYYVVKMDVAGELETEGAGPGYEAVPIQPARVFLASKGKDQQHENYYSATPTMKTEYEMYPMNQDDIVVMIWGTDYAKSYWLPLRGRDPYE